MDSIIPGGRYHNRRIMKFPSLGRKDLMYEVKELAHSLD